MNVGRPTGLADDAPVIEAQGVGKTYRLYPRPIDRLWQAVWPGGTARYREFVALQEVSLSLRRGEVLGIVGVNGAGKSTLLQLVAGTLTPSQGRVETRGRVAAILELGSGFNPEFTGRENLYLNAATLGLSKAEIDARAQGIIAFAGIGDHIDQPVKTYSSGMTIRLAFSIATSVEPDVLIIDEALSVGDGAFRRQSFDRIQEIKARGTALLFCSHVVYHVETFCDRALWLHRGRVVMAGGVTEVLQPYQAFVDAYAHDPQAVPGVGGPVGPVWTGAALPTSVAPAAAPVPASPRGEARIESVGLWLDGVAGTELSGLSGQACLEVEVAFASDPTLPAPTVAVTLTGEGGSLLGSSLSRGVPIARNEHGTGRARITIDALPLNRGRYRVGVYLFCERGLHGYAMLDPAGHLTLTHDGREHGPLLLAGRWESVTPGQDREDA